MISIPDETGIEDVGFISCSQGMLRMENLLLRDRIHH